MSSTNNQSWLQRNWRWITATTYWMVCLFDFLLAPIFLAWFQWKTNTPYSAWAPLTIQGGGIYHLSMGAIVGVTSWGKSQERIRGQDQEKSQ